MKKIINLFVLTADEGLEKQFLFWFVIFLPIFIAISLGIPVWTDYSLEFNALAYGKFIEISRLSIGIASLTIPLGVLIGRLHGTKQTALQIANSRLQIQNTEQDNKTKLYLSHFEHFCTHISFVESLLIDRFSMILPSEDKLIIDKLAMYRLMYPHNSLVNGVKPIGTHLSEFSHNTMARLAKTYLMFSHSKSDNFEKNLKSLEEEFINAQLRCFRCNKTRKSIFNKNEYVLRNKEFLFGVSPKLSDYFSQVEFLLELLDGIESFEFNNPEERVGHRVLVMLRMPHSLVLHESPEHIVMWKAFQKSLSEW